MRILSSTPGSREGSRFADPTEPLGSATPIFVDAIRRTAVQPIEPLDPQRVEQVLPLIEPLDPQRVEQVLPLTGFVGDEQQDDTLSMPEVLDTSAVVEAAGGVAAFAHSVRGIVAELSSRHLESFRTLPEVNPLELIGDLMDFVRRGGSYSPEVSPSETRGAETRDAPAETGATSDAGNAPAETGATESCLSRLCSLFSCGTSS